MLVRKTRDRRRAPYSHPDDSDLRLGEHLRYGLSSVIFLLVIFKDSSAFRVWRLKISNVSMVQC